MDPKVKQRFQAVTVRYVHDVLTGETLNIGVVLVCSAAQYAGARFLTQWSRITGAFPAAELPDLRHLATAISDACIEATTGDSLQLQLLPETDIKRFLGQIVPPEDAAIQFSEVLRGVTGDPEATLRDLHQQYVAKNLPPSGERVPRQDDDVWQAFARRLPRPEVLVHLSPFTLHSPHLDVYFERAWRNHKWHAAQPLSLDLLEHRSILDKAVTWTGRLMTVRPSQRDAEVTFLVGLPPADSVGLLQRAAQNAVAILKDNLVGEAKVITEDQSSELAEELSHDLLDTDRRSE